MISIVYSITSVLSLIIRIILYIGGPVKVKKTLPVFILCALCAVLFSACTPGRILNWAANLGKPATSGNAYFTTYGNAGYVTSGNLYSVSSGNAFYVSPGNAIFASSGNALPLSSGQPGPTSTPKAG